VIPRAVPPGRLTATATTARARPAAVVDDDEEDIEIDPAAKAEFVKNGATTFFHQVGTARMGKKDSAVVGTDLKVKGIEGLRIVDGSIMPRIVTCATMATCVVIGERGAELILG